MVFAQMLRHAIKRSAVCNHAGRVEPEATSRSRQGIATLRSLLLHTRELVLFVIVIVQGAAHAVRLSVVCPVPRESRLVCRFGCLGAPDSPIVKIYCKAQRLGNDHAPLGRQHSNGAPVQTSDAWAVAGAGLPVVASVEALAALTSGLLGAGAVVSSRSAQNSAAMSAVATA